MITDINQLELSKSYTFADYLLWNFTERLEIIKGRVFKISPAPKPNNQRVLRVLNRYFDRYFEFKSCEVFFAPFDVIFASDTDSIADSKNIVQPDLCIICDINKITKRGCEGSPDLIIEVLSEGNSEKEINYKFDLYQNNGVKEYWIVNPVHKNILLYYLKDSEYISLKPFTINDKIKSYLFPEIEIELTDIFKIEK